MENPLLHMLWGIKRDIVEVDTTPIEVITLSLVAYSRLLLVCYSNQRSAKSVMLYIRFYKLKKNISSQRT